MQTFHVHIGLSETGLLWSSGLRAPRPHLNRWFHVQRQREGPWRPGRCQACFRSPLRGGAAAAADGPALTCVGRQVRHELPDVSFSRSLCGPQDCLLPQCFLLFFSFFKEKWPQLLTFYLRRVTFVNSPFICFVCFLIIPQDRTQVMHFRQEHHGNDMSSVHPGRRDSRWLDSLLVMTVVVTWLKVISVRFLHCWVTIMLFVINKCSMGRYFETM